MRPLFRLKPASFEVSGHDQYHSRRPHAAANRPDCGV